MIYSKPTTLSSLIKKYNKKDKDGRNIAHITRDAGYVMSEWKLGRLIHNLLFLKCTTIIGEDMYEEVRPSSKKDVSRTKKKTPRDRSKLT